MSSPTTTRIPRIPLWRRGAAWAIDFAIVGVVAGAAGAVVAQGIFFVLGWLGMRVLLVVNNKGQSVGRWALDLKVWDLRRGGIPGLVELAQREGLLAIEGFLVLVGLASFSQTTPWAPLLFIPLAIDCGIAWLDPDRCQAFHDRLANTIVVPSKRGYSLDLKIKKWLVDLRQRVK